MAFWNKKKKDSLSQINDFIDEIREIVENDKKVSIMMVVSTENGGSSLIQGDARELEKALLQSAETNDGFKMLLTVVGSKIDKTGELGAIKGKVKDEFDKLFSGLKPNESRGVDLPNGVKGLAINSKNIDNISEEEIDDIVDNMIKGLSETRKGNKDEDES